MDTDALSLCSFDSLRSWKAVLGRQGGQELRATVGLMMFEKNSHFLDTLLERMKRAYTGAWGVHAGCLGRYFETQKRLRSLLLSSLRGDLVLHFFHFPIFSPIFFLLIYQVPLEHFVCQGMCWTICFEKCSPKELQFWGTATVFSRSPGWQKILLSSWRSLDWLTGAGVGLCISTTPRPRPSEPHLDH
jgi:hypothetical protein